MMAGQQSFPLFSDQLDRTIMGSHQDFEYEDLSHIHVELISAPPKDADRPRNYSLQHAGIRYSPVKTEPFLNDEPITQNEQQLMQRHRPNLALLRQPKDLASEEQDGHSLITGPGSCTTHEALCEPIRGSNCGGSAQPLSISSKSSGPDEDKAVTQILWKGYSISSLVLELIGVILAICFLGKSKFPIRELD
jgi:hypothetical protein